MGEGRGLGPVSRPNWRRRSPHPTLPIKGEGFQHCPGLVLGIRGESPAMTVLGDLTRTETPPYKCRALAPQMRHPRRRRSMLRRVQFVREDAELEERRENAEAGVLAHPLDPGQYRPGAADEGAVPLSMRPSAVAFRRPAAAHLRGNSSSSASRGVARQASASQGLAQEVVEGSRPPVRPPARARRSRRHRSGTPTPAAPAPPHSRIALPARDRRCGSARRGRPTKTSPGTGICAWGRPPRQAVSLDPCDGTQTRTDAGSGTAAATN